MGTWILASEGRQGPGHLGPRAEGGRMPGILNLGKKVWASRLLDLRRDQASRLLAFFLCLPPTPTLRAGLPGSGPCLRLFTLPHPILEVDRSPE